MLLLSSNGQLANYILRIKDLREQWDVCPHADVKHADVGTESPVASSF